MIDTARKHHQSIMAVLRAEAVLRGTIAPACMTSEEIRIIVERFTSMTAVIRDADPADKAETYRDSA